MRDYKAKLEESELLRERLSSRIDSLCKRYENEEVERETLLQQVERLNEKVSCTIFIIFFISGDPSQIALLGFSQSPSMLGVIRWYSLNN